MSIYLKNTEIIIFPSSFNNGKTMSYWTENSPKKISDAIPQSIDAVVDSSNNYLYAGSGIALCLERKLRDTYLYKKRKLSESSNLIRGKVYFIQHDEFSINKGIIEAISIHYDENNKISLSNSNDVYNCTYNSLLCADENNCKTIALPQFVSRRGYSIFNENIYKIMNSAMFSAINDYIFGNDSMIEKVILHPSDINSEKNLTNLFK